LVELANDQFDEIKIREVSCFGAVPMNSAGRPALRLRNGPQGTSSTEHFNEEVR
jgi:hypothetical protein